MLVKAGKEGVPSQRTSAPKASHYKVNLPVAAVHIKLYLGFAVVVIQVIVDYVITLGTGEFF